MNETIICYELEGGAYAPTKGHKADAGWDLYIPESCRPFYTTSKVRCVDTGVRVLLPVGFMALILPRSSSTAKNIIVHPGVIDAGYKGTLKVCISDQSLSPSYIKPGMRLAQLVILPRPQILLMQGDVFSVSTERGEGGLGSTGE